MEDASRTVLCIEQINYIYFLFPVPTLRYHPGSWSITCVFELFKLLFFQQQLYRYSCFILSGGINAAGICQLESWFLLSLVCCVLYRWKVLSVSGSVAQ